MHGSEFVLIFLTDTTYAIYLHVVVSSIVSIVHNYNARALKVTVFGGKGVVKYNT